MAPATGKEGGLGRDFTFCLLLLTPPPVTSTSSVALSFLFHTHPSSSSLKPTSTLRPPPFTFLTAPTSHLIHPEPVCTRQPPPSPSSFKVQQRYSNLKGTEEGEDILWGLEEAAPEEQGEVGKGEGQGDRAEDGGNPTLGRGCCSHQQGI